MGPERGSERVRVAVVGHVEWVTFAEVEHVPEAGEIVESDWYRYRSFYDPEDNVLHITVPDRHALGLDRG